jgi:hypothetical protein
LRLLHREFNPAASVPVHSVVSLKDDDGATVEYEVLRRTDDGSLYYAKVAPEATESIIAAVVAQSDGLSTWNSFRLSPDGVKKFEEAIAKIAATNNAKGNGNGRLGIVLDGSLILTIALAPNRETKRWEPAVVAPVFEITATSFAQAADRETAFNSRNRK